MAKPLIDGIYAAVLTPRDSKGNLDEAALENHLTFLLKRGIRNFAINGATGEYHLNSLADIKQSLNVAKSILPPGAKFVCGIGAAGFRHSLELGHAGIEAGAEALLLPTPYFFPYAQDDLAAFIFGVASELPAPILLYNLPQFTSGLEAKTILDALRECPNVIGIKDSSGSLENLRALTDSGIDCSRLIGNDGSLAQALAEGICDGVISGVASVLPEIIQAIFAADRSRETAGFNPVVELNEFIDKIDCLPVPWGLKAVAEARGISKASYPIPVSARRAKQISDLQDWFGSWIGKIAEREQRVRN